MAAESDDQPVLLTEGEYVPDVDEKSSEKPLPNEELQQQESSESASTVASGTPAEKQVPGADSQRPATAPEPAPAEADVDDGSLKSVEQSVLNALPLNQTHLPTGGGDDEEETWSWREKVPSEEGDTEEGEYVDPPEDPYKRAVTYMERHKIMQIFQKLTAEIVYHRPSDPLAHMLGELHKMKKERDTSADANTSSAAGQ